MRACVLRSLAGAAAQALLLGHGGLVRGGVSVAQEGARVLEHQLRSLLHELVIFAMLLLRQEALVVPAGQLVHPRLDLRRQAPNDVRLLVRRDWACGLLPWSSLRTRHDASWTRRV
jgi:hypothetical protein